TTLVTVALIQSLRLPARNNIKLAVLAVFSINSGGAALITGDVTTLMIFTAGKVGIGDLFALIAPGLIACLLLAAMLLPGFEGQLKLERAVTPASNFDICVAIIFIATIVLTLVINLVVRVPPLLVFMFGLSLVFMLSRFMSREESEQPIIDYIRKIEFDTLLFFLGILLVVGMLQEIGTLAYITELYARFSPPMANFLIGCVSAVIDNVPLTAAVLKSNLTMSLTQWLGFTYSVGVGGSLLAIGSAAGVLMMSKIEGLGFISYLRYTPHLAVAYAAGYSMILMT
ncbi:MAG: sodium:proton antiporter NhaD, partial [Halioglobus sp.]|nr:sodium:proton antiporter NhaD [Halioglobus sp.]